MAVLTIVLLSFIQIVILIVKEKAFAIFAETIKRSISLSYVMTAFLMKKDVNQIA